MANNGVPFGKPFKYTEPEYHVVGDKKPWWKRIIPKKRQPIGWVVTDDEIPEAHLLTNDGEVRVSPVEQQAIIPVFKEDTAIAFSEQCREQNGNERDSS